MASSHGWSLEGIELFELPAPGGDGEDENTLFHPSEVELGEVTKLLLNRVSLERLSPLYGAERRRLRVAKMLGVRFRGGYHDFAMETGGLRVFPRLRRPSTWRRFIQDRSRATTCRRLTV